MTECERILEKGVFDETFLREEVRCGFKVTAERKNLWMVILDILLEFDKVCRKHNLHYFLDSGTLLGAVRHKGFIPWDDDIDVAMPREDYEKLITLSYEFEEPYLLQYPKEGSDYWYSFVKVRNINTTFAPKAFMYNAFNQGCFIDVFPYDEFGLEESESLFETMTTLVRALSVSMKLPDPKYLCDDSKTMELLSVKTPLEVFRMVEDVAKGAKERGAGRITSLVCPMTHFRKKAYMKDWFFDTQTLSFEGFEFPAPIRSHEVLSMLFGNYLQFPPVEERGLNHSGAFCHTDIDFDTFKRIQLSRPE